MLIFVQMSLVILNMQILHFILIRKKYLIVSIILKNKRILSCRRHKRDIWQFLIFQRRIAQYWNAKILFNLLLNHNFPS